MTSYDVIVVGGGHAGCEAAYAAARRGCRTLMLAIDRSSIGAMSCNPAIGGVGKGHLVREVDAFAGIIGQAADVATIHRRLLNRSKGPAVQGPRVQADRRRYAAAVRTLLAGQPLVTIGEGEVVDLEPRASGGIVVRMADGTILFSRALILSSGTFLGGRLFRGRERLDGGRLGERGAHPLADAVRGLGLATRRLKTGTPPRLDGRTIDWSGITRQPSDQDRWQMSAWSTRTADSILFCGIARTTEATHDIVRAALSSSPLWDGTITGRGPRYCPSIEDKVVRFGDRDGHQIFLEPETADGGIIYPNGISTSLSVSAQEAFVRSIPGLHRSTIVEPGYAVEYTAVDARCCDAGLMVRTAAGLFLAGQINGTTGYEEAAAQGLVAGLNAAAWAKGLPPVPFDRRSSYIGVLVDDLTLQETTEPYRMLTARSENRLALRADNAERRLAPPVAVSGVLNTEQRHAAEGRRARVDIFRERGRRGEDLAIIDDPAAAEAAADLLYEPYLARARNDDVRASRLRQSLAAVQFGTVRGLSAEMVERLERARPQTVGDAARVSGITPAAVTALMAATCR